MKMSDIHVIVMDVHNSSTHIFFKFIIRDEFISRVAGIHHKCFFGQISVVPRVQVKFWIRLPSHTHNTGRHECRHILTIQGDMSAVTYSQDKKIKIR